MVEERMVLYCAAIHLESLFEHAEAQRTPLQTQLSWAHQ